MSLSPELQLQSLRRYVGLKYAKYIKNADDYLLSSLLTDLDTYSRDNIDNSNLQNLSSKFREVIISICRGRIDKSVHFFMDVINLQSEETLGHLLYLIDPLEKRY